MTDERQGPCRVTSTGVVVWTRGFFYLFDFIIRFITLISFWIWLGCSVAQIGSLECFRKSAARAVPSRAPSNSFKAIVQIT